MWDDVEREWVRREVDMYMTTNSMTPQDMAERVLQSSATLRTNTRSGYRAISRKAIEGLVRGTRGTRKDAVAALKQFLMIQRRLPAFLFEVNSDTVNHAKGSMAFFRAQNFPSGWIKKFQGMYLFFRPREGFAAYLLADYLSSDKVLVLRGVLNDRIENRFGETRSTYVEGYLIVVRKILLFNLRDGGSPNAHIIEAPLTSWPLEERFEEDTPAQRVRYFVPEDGYRFGEAIYPGLPNFIATTFSKGTTLKSFGPKIGVDGLPHSDMYLDIFGGSGEVVQTWQHRQDRLSSET